MRYFSIYADSRNIQPQLVGWSLLVRPNIFEGGKIYEALGRRNRMKAELPDEMQFLDIISSPCFMVSKDFADLIRLYCPGIKFKYMLLFDEKNRRTAAYQIPDLPEIDCLDESSEFNPGRNVIRKGILRGDRIREEPIFRLKGMEGRYIISLERKK